MLSVLLFNWVGYKLFTAFCEERAAGSLDASLEKDDYDSSLLVMLSIPADVLPYCNSSPDFQPAKGFLEVGNLRYREIKRRVFNDSVEFLCILDGASSRLQSAGNDYFSLVNDLQKNGRSKIPGPTGKTNHNVSKIIYYFGHDFPDLHGLATSSVRSPRLQRAGISAGHTRIGLQPPKSQNA